MAVTLFLFPQHLERKGVGPRGSPGEGWRRRECKTEPRPGNPQRSNAPPYKFGASSSKKLPAPVSGPPKHWRQSELAQG